MKIKKPLRLKGYLCMSRREILLLQQRGFDFTDLGFYHFLLLAADWDPRHSTYKHVVKNDNELAIEALCDPSTIYRRKQVLERYGLIKIEDGLIRIVDFEKFTFSVASKLAELDVANLQEDHAQTQEVIANMQNNHARPQENKHEIGNSFSVSSKDNLSSFDNELEVNPDDIPF